MNAPRLRRAIAGLLGILLAPSLLAAPAGTPAGRSLHGVDLAPFVHVEAWDAHLRLAGVQVVDHHYLPFQVVALYVGAEDPDPDLLSSGLVRCRIEIHWRGPALDEAGAAAWWEARFTRAVPDAGARRRLADGLGRFVRTTGAPPRGAVTRLDYDPDAGLTVVSAGGPPARFTGMELVRAILALWLSPGPGRDELLGRTPAAAQ
ncbi:MAG: chalcone isomerase family protein [Xanthomonadaceae bacterium]|jgi:hypothetical protein|nr:chalcone isomerase family protein [Xanthomonadaceae bacterium]